jgi:hypothetical protein
VRLYGAAVLTKEQSMSFLLDLLCGPARLQECAKHSDVYLTQTAAGFAIVPGSELSHEEMDAAYHTKQADFQWLDAMRRAGP